MTRKKVPKSHSCPFCHADVDTEADRLADGGYRCPNCGKGFDFIVIQMWWGHKP